MSGYTRAQVATWSKITPNQIDNLLRSEIVAATVGDVRRRFSRDEARLAVICGWFLNQGVAAENLKEVIGWLRDYMRLDGSSDTRDFATLRRRTDLHFAKCYFSDHEDITERVIARLENEYDQPGNKRDELQAKYSSSASFRQLVEEYEPVSIEQHQEDVFRLKVEMYFRGETEMFLMAAINSGTWRTRFSYQVETLEGEAGWFTINIKALFEGLSI